MENWIQIDENTPCGMYLVKDENGNEVPAIHATNLNGVKMWHPAFRSSEGFKPTHYASDKPFSPKKIK